MGWKSATVEAHWAARPASCSCQAAAVSIAPWLGLRLGLGLGLGSGLGSGLGLRLGLGLGLGLGSTLTSTESAKDSGAVSYRIPPLGTRHAIEGTKAVSSATVCRVVRDTTMPALRSALSRRAPVPTRASNVRGWFGLGFGLG